MTSSLSRSAGGSTAIAGTLFVIMGLTRVFASATTTAWIVVNAISVAMALFGLLGLTGLYAMQVRETGW
jgi:uncharacterized membrane protein